MQLPPPAPEQRPGAAELRPAVCGCRLLAPRQGELLGAWLVTAVVSLGHRRVLRPALHAVASCLLSDELRERQVGEKFPVQRLLSTENTESVSERRVWSCQQKSSLCVVC